MNEEWMSKEEKGLVKQLRERIRIDLPSESFDMFDADQDAFLLRWIRAREWNLDKAYTMLTTALKWRKENHVDKALETKMDPFFRETYPYDFAGADNCGHPVVICPFGGDSGDTKWDFRSMIAANKTDQFDHFVKYLFEDIYKTIRTYDNEKRQLGQAPITQFTAVCDLTGYAYGQLFSFGAMRKWLNFVATYEAYYPEILYRAFIVNCPSYFQVFLNMLKGVIAPRTLGKITCYSTLQSWQKDMEEFIDPAILPEQFGGTRKDNPFSLSK